LINGVASAEGGVEPGSSGVAIAEGTVDGDSNGVEATEGGEEAGRGADDGRGAAAFAVGIDDGRGAGVEARVAGAGSGAGSGGDGDAAATVGRGAGPGIGSAPHSASMSSVGGAIDGNGGLPLTRSLSDRLSVIALSSTFHDGPHKSSWLVEFRLKV
jgi:hypothetical protein